MNIPDYLHAKFELAEILRSAAVIVRARDRSILYPFEDLFARLAEDRFNIVVVGQFSRGKTSLMNAMLGSERLPMGAVPVTSVITTVQYGREERATIEYVERRLPSHISLDDLSQFVSQAGNPSNEKAISFARIEMPSELLRQGFYLVDTPGLGSAILENTRTTEAFLPEADACVVVTGYDSPLSQDELRLLRDLGARAQRCFVLINKKDRLDTTEQGKVEDHIRTQLGPGLAALEFFSVSARDAIAANRKRDLPMLQASGVPAFVNRLVRFVVEEKNSIFLRRMAGRIDAELNASNCSAECERLAALMATWQLSDATTSAENLFVQSHAHFARCSICAPVEREVLQFLQRFQYQIIIDRNARDRLRADAGLCPFHTWQYAALASPHGTCLAFPSVFDLMIERIRETRSKNTARSQDLVHQLQHDQVCILCRIGREAEQRAVAATAEKVVQTLSQPAPQLPDVCLPHLASVLEALDENSASALLDTTVDTWQRTAEDMRRYALKRDGSRRAFTTADELDADIRGLRALAGNASLSYIRETLR